MADAERVTRSSLSPHLQRISVPRPLPVLPTRVWSDEEWERIQRGHRSQDMDGRWHVFAEGPVVFLHRSWTGHGIFEATFAPADGGGWRIAEAVVERDQDRYRGDDAEGDSRTLERVLDLVVLGGP